MRLFRKSKRISEKDAQKLYKQLRQHGISQTAATKIVKIYVE